MEFSEYVALREQERSITIQSLLQEIYQLQDELARLKGNTIEQEVGFKPTEEKE